MTTVRDPEALIRRVIRDPKGQVPGLFLDSFSLLFDGDAVVGVASTNRFLNARVEARLRLDLEFNEDDQPDVWGGGMRAHTGPYIAWEFSGWYLPNATSANLDFYLQVARASIEPECEIAWVPTVEHDAMLRHRVATFAHTMALRDAQRRLDDHFGPDARIRVMKAGGWLPFQAEGNLNGEDFYFRYRSGDASLSVGGEDPVLSPRLESVEEDGGKYFDNDSEMLGFVRAMQDLVPRLSPRQRGDQTSG